jgi:hypothetical protein
MKRAVFLALSFSCAVGQWRSSPADHPVSHAELAALRMTVVGPPELADAFAAQGFVIVPHPPFHGDLLARYDGGILKVTSDGYFVDQLRGDDPQKLAEQLARGDRLAWFVRNSGTVEQRSNPGM